jgi:hypothetical protein
MSYIYRQRGENLSRVAAAPLVGLGKGRHTTLCGLGCAYAEDSTSPCTGLNLIQYNTPPSHNSAIADVETGSKLSKHQGGKGLLEDACELRYCRNMKDVDLTDGDLLSNKMEINLHMLGALMLNGLVERYMVLMLSQ